MQANNIIVKIENLSKKYLIYHQKHAVYSTLVDILAKKAKRWIQKLLFFRPSTYSPSDYEELWSLQNINVEIERGDRVGIIGRNGAGKSTLLKIISRITQPTTGRIEIQGRVSSLLEVCTGFHPELTGRENIFLNGAILGMRYTEIKRKFDEIVAFSQVEKFLDTPIKQYSGGMYTRLGFAIAAHLDPDLLIMDEVLAVGDIQFQEKCLKKLNELSGEGKTVLFVSHDIGSILSLCNKGLFLEKGLLKEYGPVDVCINAYMRSLNLDSPEWQGNEGDEHIRFYRASLVSPQADQQFYYQNEKVRLDLEYEILKPSADLVLGVGVWNQRNQLLASSHTSDSLAHCDALMQKGKRKASFFIDSILFHEGEYSVKLDCLLHNKKKIITDEITIKFLVYSEKKQTRYSHAQQKNGIFLGNNWELNE